MYSAFLKSHVSDYFNGLLLQETAIHNQLTDMQSLIPLQDKATHKLYSNIDSISYRVYTIYDSSCWKANYTLFTG